MAGKRNQYVGGGFGALLSATWGGYAALTTAKDLPQNADWFAKMMADPPVYAPWLLFAACILFLAFVFWRRDEPETDSDSVTQNSGGPGSPNVHAPNSTVNITYPPPNSAPTNPPDSSVAFYIRGNGNVLHGNRSAGFPRAYDVAGDNNYMAYNLGGGGTSTEPVIPARIDASLELLAAEELQARVASFVSFLVDLNDTITDGLSFPAFKDRMEKNQVAFAARSMEGQALRNEMLNRLARPLTADIHRVTLCLEAGSVAGADPFMPTARALQALAREI